MYPVLLTIGKFKLYSFGSFIALGAILGGYFLYRAAKYKKLPTGYLFDAALYSLLAGLLGARIGYYILYQDQFQTVWQALYFWQGGLVALTGLAVGFFTFLKLVKDQRVSVWKMLDIGVIALLIGWFFGKFGCHLSSCAIGKAGSGVLTVNGSYAVDLVSAIWALITGTTLYIQWKNNRWNDGIVFLTGIEALLIGELIINTLRADFGTSIAKAEAFVLSLLIVVVYAYFWRLHGPEFERNKFIGSISRTVKRLKKLRSK